MIILLYPVNVANYDDVHKICSRIHTDPRAFAYLAPKSNILHFFAENVDYRAAAFLKQELLSRGGDVIVTKHVIDGKTDTSDILIMGTPTQIRNLMQKLHAMDCWGLKELRAELTAAFEGLKVREWVMTSPAGHTITLNDNTRLMAIMNLTPDSFHAPSRINDNILQTAEKFLSEGAYILDVGAESTRPGAVAVSESEESARLIPALKELAADWLEDFNDEFKIIEPQGIEVIVEEVETPKKEAPVEIQDNLVNAIYACHDGVIRMIPSYPTVVETSSNLAIINIGEGKASLKILARSSREDMKDYIVKTLESCFNMAGMKVVTAGSYGGWDPNPDSEILHLLLKEYKELFGKDGIIQVDHAGLECSVILGKYPHLDVVSLGPTMKSPHTTTERALIETVAPFWELLKKTLADVPAK